MIEAAGFEAMRRAGDTLRGETGAAFRGGGGTFFHHGENGRWHGRLDATDLGFTTRRSQRLPEDFGPLALAAGSAAAAPERLAKRYREGADLNLLRGGGDN